MANIFAQLFAASFVSLFTKHSYSVFVIIFDGISICKNTKKISNRSHHIVFFSYFCNSYRYLRPRVGIWLTR